MAEAFDGVEQGELRAGMWLFAADDEPGAGWVAVVGDEAGQFADVGAVAGFAVAVEGGDPLQVLFGGEDGLADRFGDRDADGEAGIDAGGAQTADVGEEPLGAAGGVRSDQDRVPCRCASGIWVRASSRTVM
jgi:hypothetical protein